MTNSLNSIFTAVVFKTLANVDLPKKGSNQHEINGVGALRDFFETDEQISGNISWHYFSDNSEPLSYANSYTFYDARARSAARTGRTEWRMYYSGDFLSHAIPGDILVLARNLDGKVFGLIFQKNSGWLRAAHLLFQSGDVTPKLQLITSQNLRERSLEFVKQQILEELGIGVSIPSFADDDEIAFRELELANEQGRDFPSTTRMSELAQSLIEFDSKDCDATLVAFIDREERIFRSIEKILVNRKLKEGFYSVDDFISYSLSVQNRRKSRMGFALQNHLSRIFVGNGLKFDAQVLTEGKSKPDFIFPGKLEYANPRFASEKLVMLASKSSCKERWRQILDEAARIPTKHLCTLEQAISVDQTSAMLERRVVLVIPDSFHSTYTEVQRRNLWSVNRFVDFIKFKQGIR